MKAVTQKKSPRIFVAGRFFIGAEGISFASVKQP
jgi:hypothetical protein